MALRLPRFLRELPIVTDRFTPTIEFHQWWESVLKQIENSVNSITAALEAAGIALDAAAAAQAAADTVNGVAKLNSSGITGLTITASDAGTDATVIVSDHTRVYGDGASVSVIGTTRTALAYDTSYLIYYSDPTFVGGTVSYTFATNLSEVSQTGSNHVVGIVKTPAAGMPPEEGTGPRPPGFNFEVNLA